MSRQKKNTRERSQFFVLLVLTLVTASIYLFKTAPLPLPDEQGSGPRFPVATLFALAAAEQEAARLLYTREIVGKGMKTGLAFSEDWQVEGVDAGPLPALFLRETASGMERRPERLSLFLGSEFAINDANKFSGEQLTLFKTVSETRMPTMSFSQDLNLQMAMYPDLAVAQACVDCHNNHPQTPKNDWRLNDVMGATTWAYPREEVGLAEILETLACLRASIADTYASYLQKTRTFKNPPKIGDQWPADGYYLPSLATFAARLEAQVSQGSLNLLLTSVSNRVGPTTNLKIMVANDEPKPAE